MACYRLKPGTVQKPRIEVTQKASRTVKTKIYPVPRCDVDSLLALEYKASAKQPSSIVDSEVDMLENRATPQEFIPKITKQPSGPPIKVNRDSVL